MIKYKVLKEFVGTNSVFYLAGDIYSTPDTSVGEFNATLITNGFIEEIKEDEVWCRGVKITASPAYRVTSRGNATEISRKHKSFDDRVRMGSVFNTKKEAEKYARHLELENQLMNIAMRDYGAKTKRCSLSTGSYNQMPTVEPGRSPIYFPVWFTSIDCDDMDRFTGENRDLLQEWASYYVEEE
jgi:hypothetical protein